MVTEKLPKIYERIFYNIYWWDSAPPTKDNFKDTKRYFKLPFSENRHNHIG